MINHLSSPALPRRTRFTLWLLIGLIAAALWPAAPLYAQESDGATSSATVEFEACAELDEAQVRSELNAIAQEIFAADANGIDLDAIIERQWDALGMDALVDRQVDEAVREVRRDEDLLATFLSGWSPERAADLARVVAERAFSAEPFRQAVDELATAVAQDIQAEIELLAAESVALNLLCLRQFIDRRYSAAIVDAFAADIRQSSGDAALLDPLATDNGLLAVIDLHKTALGGVGVIIAAQITRRVTVRISRRISQRVAGRISARILGRVGTELIPVVGWIIGTGLIVYDVVDSLDGSLPQIQESLKEPEVKAAIRSEIGLAVAPELRQELPVLARDIANDLYSEWLDFQRKYRQVLTLADENPAFGALLATAAAALEGESGPGENTLANAAEWVDVMLATSGRSALDAAIEDGTLAAALALPVAAVDILAAGGTLQTVLDWAALAGSDFEAVLAGELYKYQSPDVLDRGLLRDLLDLENPTLAAKLALLPPEEIRTLLGISMAGLQDLAAALTADELSQLAAYLVAMDQSARNRLVSTVTNDPGAMTLLARPAVRSYLTAGNDAGAALAFLSSPADVMGFANDVLSLATSQVSTGLFAAKYGWPLTATGLALPVLLALALLSLLLRPLRRLKWLIGND